MIAEAIKTKQEMVESKKRKDQPILVEIQSCSNCDAHLFTVRHQQSKYYSHYDAIKKKLRQKNIAVRKRAVPDCLYKKSPYCPPNVFYTVQSNQVVYFPEIGSFEVYLQGKKIFSKLETLKWPSPETIALEVEKMLSEIKMQKQIEGESEKLEKSTDKQEAIKEIVKQPHKKDQFRIKSKKTDQQPTFRYSIDRRNLFRKPENNYLFRKIMTARNHQSDSQSTYRSNNNAVLYKKPINEQQLLAKFEESIKKEFTDEAVLEMYGKLPVKNNSNQTEKQTNKNLPEIQKIKKLQGQGNIYLQPILPKSGINLQYYTRQKQIMANKIHQQRKSYDASKQLKAEIFDKHLNIAQARHSLHLKAKFNANCNQLLKGKQEKKQLIKIKEATQQNQSKQRDRNQIGKSADSKQEQKKNSSNNQLSERVKSKQSTIKIQAVSIKQQINDLNENNQIHWKLENKKIFQVKKQQKKSEFSANQTENIIQVNQQTKTIQKEKEDKSHGPSKQKDQFNKKQIIKNSEQLEKNQQKPLNVQDEQAYEAQFEGQNEKNADDIQKEVENVQKVQQTEQNKQLSPQKQVDKQKEIQYDDEQFDKQQQEVQQLQNKITDIENIVQIAFQKAEQIVADSG